jgi:hypothetical protein
VIGAFEGSSQPPASAVLRRPIESSYVLTIVSRARPGWHRGLLRLVRRSSAGPSANLPRRAFAVGVPGPVLPDDAFRLPVAP